MKEQIEAAVENKGRANVFGPEAVRIAKELAKEHGYLWRDCTTKDGFEQGILYR